MDELNAVRCMRHCSSDFNVFYVEFPECCPVCRSSLKGSILSVPPFFVPHPFVSSSQAPYSVVVKPTDGCFLKTYQSGQDLHIGITTSSGLVYNYDEGGIHVDDNTTWSFCIALTLTSILNSKRWDTIAQNWDEKLRNYGQHPDWNSEKYGPLSLKWQYDAKIFYPIFWHYLEVHLKYNPSSHNCYNFVLSFLGTITPGQHCFKNKERFSRDHIVPLTTRAAQYIDLYRRILSEGTQIRKASVT